MEKHILIAGEVQVGKSTLIRKLLSHCSNPVYGFSTVTSDKDEYGFRRIFIQPAGQCVHCRSKNLVGVSNKKFKISYPEVFDQLGSEYLDAPPGSVILMDELGFLEDKATHFQHNVFRCLDGNLPVIAAVKLKSGYRFLDQVKSHPNTETYVITKDNRDMVFQQLVPIVQSWNSTK